MDGIHDAPEARARALGGTVRRFAPEPRGLRITRLGEANLAPDAQYIIKGLLAPGDLGLLIGPPASGKTTVGPRIAWAIATGEPLLGHRTAGGPVLWCAAEDFVGALRRFIALRQETGEVPPIAMATGFDLSGERGLPCAAAVAEAADRVNARLVVIDTLAAGFHGLDENDLGSMSRAVATLRSIASDRRAVLALHHTPRNGTTPRGHGALEGSADLILRVEPPQGDGPRTLRVAKNRSGLALEVWPFTIRSVTIGGDGEGDAITAPAACFEAADRDRTRPPLSRQRRRALQYLHDVIARGGEDLPPLPGFPRGVRGCRVEDWRRECDARGLAASDDPDTRERVFRRLRRDLADVSLIAEREGWVWPVYERAP